MLILLVKHECQLFNPDSSLDVYSNSKAFFFFSHVERRTQHGPIRAVYEFPSFLFSFLFLLLFPFFIDTFLPPPMRRPKEARRYFPQDRKTHVSTILLSGINSASSHKRVTRIRRHHAS